MGCGFMHHPTQKTVSQAKQTVFFFFSLQANVTLQTIYFIIKFLFRGLSPLDAGKLCLVNYNCTVHDDYFHARAETAKIEIVARSLSTRCCWWMTVRVWREREQKGRIINSYRELPREFFCLCCSLFVCTGGEKLFCR